MPALFSHYRLGQDVLKNTNKTIKNDITSNIKYYNMYNQGWDNLYYHFSKWNYYKHIGYISHKKNVTSFFSNAIKYIKDNNLENNSKYTNLVYGILNHYTMDTIIHPYINFQVKNLGITHTRIEFMLDSNIRTDKKGSIYKSLIPKLKFDKEYKKFINYIYENTYGKENIGNIWNRSHNNGYYLYRYFINDNHGIKTFIYRIFDIFNPSSFKLHQNTFYIKNFDTRLLNKDKLSWHHPDNKDEVYNYSLEELYNNTLKICLKLNKLAYKVIHNKEDINVLLDLIDKINIKNMQELLLK